MRKYSKKYGINDLFTYYKQWIKTFPHNFLKKFNPNFVDINEKMNNLNSFSFESYEPSFKDLNRDVVETLCMGRTKKKRIKFITESEKFVEEPPQKDHSKCRPIPCQELVCNAIPYSISSEIKSITKLKQKRNRLTVQSKVHGVKNISSISDLNYNIKEISGIPPQSMNFNPYLKSKVRKH